MQFSIIGRGVVELLAGILLIATLSFYGFAAEPESQAGAKPNILLLHSYHDDMPWSKKFNQGFQKRGKEAASGHVQVFTEWLDIARLSDSWNADYLGRQLAQKYAGKNITVVVSDDLKAAKAFNDYAAKSLPDVTHIYAGTAAHQFTAGDSVFAAVWLPTVANYASGIDLIRAAHPDASRIEVLTDAYSAVTKKRLQQLKNEFAPYKNEIEINFFTEFTIDQLVSHVSSLPPDVILLYCLVFEDETGQRFIPIDVAQKIAAVANAPVYSYWDTLLGSGVFGGAMVSAERTGWNAADLALRLVAGEKVDFSAINSAGQTGLFFDWGQLKRWGLEEDDFPAQSTFLNRLPSFYSENTVAVWGTLLFFGLQSLLMLFLYLNRRKISQIVEVRTRDLSDEVQERKGAEQLARESEMRFRALHDGSFAGIFIHEQGRIVDSNQELEEITGFSREELIGSDGLNLLAPECREEAMAHMRENDGQPYEVEGLRKEGTRYHCLVQGKNIPYYGRDARVVEVRDISEQVKLLEQLRQAEKMQAVGQLAGGVAHDFNNQLASISGYAEMLGRHLVDDRLKRYLQRIVTATKRASDLTQQLLAFSRKGKYLSVPVSIHSILGEVTAILGRSIDKRIKIQRKLNAVPAMIIGDPSQIQNALLNIALNARDAMPEGGKLSFETSIENLTEEFCAPHGEELSSGNYLKIRVVDDGCGMDAETQKHIFEPFFTTKSVGKGTGMWLASVYGTVRNHKGFIDVESEQGRGTCFDIYLPMAEEVA